MLAELPACRKRGAAQGILAQRVTKNANGRIVHISVSDLLGCECVRTVRGAAKADVMLTGGGSSPLMNPDRVTILDGSQSEEQGLKQVQPNVNIWRCEYHLKAETRHGVEVADKKVYGQLRQERDG